MLVAFQMDALASLHPERDTSLLLIKEGIKRGFEVFYYEPHHLFYDQGHVMAECFQLSLDPESPTGLKQQNVGHRDLDTMDYIWVRQDPPFHMAYITTTYLLDLLKHPKIVNRPSGLRNGPEKLLPLAFHAYMPPTLITSLWETLCSFFDHHQSVILKPLYDYSGHSVHKADTLDALKKAYDHEKEHHPDLPLIIQKFLPAIYKGDKRIFMVNGQAVGCFRRIPMANSYLSNFSFGATAAPDYLTDIDHDLCRALSPILKKMGLFFVGLDVIDGKLIEINVTSPTGVPTYNRLYHTALEETIWNSLLNATDMG